ncbi:hypothetical protein DL98DRAFT_22623 [Cadophora sp. DSE1049]|nr:hypothetical protein DL98DRAFT_22623 [Cadophora sp. DSE1049]
MAAIELGEGEDGYAFIDRLITSKMIEVKLSSPDEPLIRVPEALACAVSKRLEDMCKATSNRKFVSDDIIPMGLWNQRPLWSTFVEWLYTKRISACRRQTFFAMWTLSEKLIAPKFTNAILERLSAEHGLSIDVSNDAELFFAHPANIEDMCVSAWELADFSPEEKAGLDVTAGKVLWENKKRLQFMLDCAAYPGLEIPGVRSLYNRVDKNGVNKVVLTSRLLQNASGHLIGPPWTHVNIHKYMTEEPAIVEEPVQTGLASAKRKSTEELAGDKERSKKVASS